MCRGFLTLLINNIFGMSFSTPPTDFTSKFYHQELKKDKSNSCSKKDQ
jgi:hypothetical protein